MNFLFATIAIVALVSCALILLLAKTAINQNSAKKDKINDSSVADLLEYAALIDDDILINKDGSFSAMWLYKGADSISSTISDQELLSARINKVFNSRQSEFMIHVDAVRTPMPSYFSDSQSFFKDEVCKAIDNKRKMFFEKKGTMYGGYFILTLTWLPPLHAENKFVELMFDDDRERLDNIGSTKKLIYDFKQHTDKFSSELSTAFKLTRLGSYTKKEDGKDVRYSEILSHLQFCITGIKQNMRLPETPIYLDAVLGGQEFWTGVVPKMGENFIQCVSIEGFPLSSYSGMLNALSDLDCEYRWSTRFIMLERHTAISHFEKFRKKWKQKVRGFLAQVFNLQSSDVDEDALDMTTDAGRALAEINSGLVNYGYYSSTLVLMSDDRDLLHSNSLKLKKIIETQGFVARIETINTVEAFLGTLPANSRANVRRPLISTLVLADILPTSSIWTGSPTNPCDFYPENAPALMQCVTKGNTPFYFNLHVDDLGHTLVVGKTGGGKSTLLCAIAAQFRRYENSQIYCFDKGRSMYALTKAAGGIHYEVGVMDQQEKLAFAPFSTLESKSDVTWCINWIEDILRLNNLEPSVQRSQAIAKAVFQVYESEDCYFSDFYNLVQDEDIKAVLSQYIVGGAFDLLDSRDDGLKQADFSTFEMEELLNLNEKFSIPVLSYLFRQIEKSLDGRPTLIILDEAWLLFTRPIFAAKIKEWLLVLRKANAAVVLATQTLDHIFQSNELFDTIHNSTATKVFLPFSGADSSENKVLYKKFGLSDEQIKIIKTAKSKREYFALSDNGSRLFQLALDDFMLAFLGVSEKSELNTIKDYENSYGENWVRPYLNSLNEDLDKYL